MSNLTAKFTALEGQINDDANEAHSQRESMLTTLADIQSAIASINSDMLLMKQSLLGAIGQSGACFPCPTPSITVPTTSPDTHPVDVDHCKRSHAIIATIHNILAAMDTMQSFNVVGTFNVVNDAISEVIAAVAAGDTVPLPSFPETVGIVGNYISYAGERLFSGIGLIEQFSPLEDSLVSAIYLSDSPDAAQSAYNAVIDASGISLVGKYLIKAVAYNALWSYFLDPATAPDLSGFSGTDCFTFDCATFDSVETLLGGTTTVQAIAWPVQYLPIDDVDGFTSDRMTWATINMNGWTVTPTETVQLFLVGGSSATPVIGGTTFTIPIDTDAVAVVWGSPEVPFSVTVCPPA